MSKNEKPQEGAMLKIKDVQNILGVSRQAVHNIRKAGLLEGTRVGLRAIRFSREEVERYLASRKESPVQYKKHLVIDKETEGEEEQPED